MLSNIDKLIKAETLKAVKELLEGSLSADQSDPERARQDSQAAITKARGIVSSDSKSKKTDEAEDDAEDKKSDQEEKTPEQKSSEPEKQEDRTDGKGTADSPKLKTPKRTTLEEPTVTSLIDKLNAMRGGQSLNDVEVRKSFTQYFDGLTVSERQSLLIFLTGIAQILAGTQKGAEALDPADVGLRVKGDVEKSKEKPKKKAVAQSGREGTADNPIVVGEKADKSAILRVLSETRQND